MKIIKYALLIALALPACDETEPNGPDTTEMRDGEAGLPNTAGGLWEPCLFEDEPGGLELDGWGCNTTALACQKPVGDSVTSICVPYTADGCPDDIEYDGEPFGLGYVEEKSYCQPLCLGDSDCLDGMQCSAYSMCAWVHG